MTMILALALLLEQPKAVIKTKAEVTENSTIVLDARSSISDRPLVWKYTGPDVPFMTFDQNDRKGVFAIVPAAVSGTYRFMLIAKGTVGTELDVDADIVIVQVIGQIPIPIPPQPDPIPIPPNPIPIPTTQLRVILVYESSSPATKDFYNVIMSAKIRDYLSTHCMKDGGRPAWRIWDKDIDASKETQSWQTAWAQAKNDTTPLPKLIIFTSDGMHSFPLPADEESAITLLKTY